MALNLSSCLQLLNSAVQACPSMSGAVSHGKRTQCTLGSSLRTECIPNTLTTILIHASHPPASPFWVASISVYWQNIQFRPWAPEHMPDWLGLFPGPLPKHFWIIFMTAINNILNPKLTQTQTAFGYMNQIQQGLVIHKRNPSKDAEAGGFLGVKGPKQSQLQSKRWSVQQIQN